MELLGPTIVVIGAVALALALGAGRIPGPLFPHRWIPCRPVSGDEPGTATR